MKTIKINIPIVINTSFGDYSLSDEAAIELADIKNIETNVKEHYFNHITYKNSEWFSAEDIPRNDPDLIGVVKRLKEKANGECSNLRIVTVEVSIDLENFDGKENVKVYGGYYGF